jgi:DNA-binding transcriptional ArsR family regulator
MPAPCRPATSWPHPSTQRAPSADHSTADGGPTEPALAAGLDPQDLGPQAEADFAPGLVSLEDAVTRDLVQLFKLFSDETRLKILAHLLQARELHVRALCELIGQSQPAVSHHLGLLRAAGLIEARRSGKHNYYRLLPQRIEDLFHRALRPADVSGQGRHVVDYLRGLSPPR